MTIGRGFALAGVLGLASSEAGGQPQLQLQGEVRLEKVMALRVGFSPDGRWLLVSGATARASAPDPTSIQFTNIRRMVVLLDAQTHRVSRELIKNQPTQDVFGADPIAFTPDGRRAVAVHERAIMAWDVESGKRVASWGKNLDDVAFSPDGRVALTRQTDFSGPGVLYTYEAFDLGTDRSLGTFQGTKDHGRMFPVDSARLYVLVVSNSRVALRNLRTAEEQVVADAVAGSGSEVSGAISSDGRTLALGGKDGSLGLWQLPELAKQRQQTGLGGHVTQLALSPDGTALAFAVEGKICVWRVSQDLVACADSKHVMGIGGVGFSRDSRTLATTGVMVGPTIKLWAVP